MFENIRRQHKDIRRKISRCKESGDLRRLLGLRDQLERVRQDIDEINDYRPTEPVFRRSYGHEFFLEGLLTEHRTKFTNKFMPLAGLLRDM